MLPPRIFESEIDQIIASNLQLNAAFRDGLVGIVFGTVHADVTAVRPQAPHVGCSGTIDLDVQLTGNRRLLIENKINAKYSVTSDGDQPSRYQRTAAAYRSHDVDCKTVLIAPAVYLRARGETCGFDFGIAFESLASWLEGTDLATLQAAIEQAETPYIGEMVEANTGFFAQYERLVSDEFPTLRLKRSPNADGGRPATSRSIYFDVPRTLKLHDGVPRPVMSIQCWEQAQPTPSVKIMIGRWARMWNVLSVPDGLSAVGGYLRPAAQSLGIAINTPLMEVERPFWEQLDAVRSGLKAAAELQHWWNQNGDLLRRWSSTAVENGIENRSHLVQTKVQLNTQWPVQELISGAHTRNPAYLTIIDDIVQGDRSARELVETYGSSDLVVSALAHVTRAIHGIGSGSVPRLEEGGWYARVGEHHVVHPGFRMAWRNARTGMTQRS